MGRSETTEHLGHIQASRPNGLDGSILSQLRNKEIYQAGPQFSTSQLHPPRIRLLSRLCAPLDGEKIMKRVERGIRSISPILISLGSGMGTLSHVWRCEMHSTKPSSATKVEHSRVSEAKELRKWSIKLFEV